MPTFFHSWRRKLGCILLLIACFLGVRSLASSCLPDYWLSEGDAAVAGAVAYALTPISAYLLIRKPPEDRRSF